MASYVSEWREVVMEGFDPWLLAKLQLTPRVKLWRRAGISLCATVDASTLWSRYDGRFGLATEPQTLQKLVQAMLINTQRGTLLRAEFRLREHPPELEESAALLYDLPSLCQTAATTPASSPPPRLEKELRRDQVAALELLVARETSPPQQEVTLQAVARVPLAPLIAPGHSAVLKRHCSLGAFPPAKRSEFARLTFDECQVVMNTPGVIQPRAATAATLKPDHLELTWSLSASRPRSFRTSVKRTLVHPRPAPNRGLSIEVGQTVKLPQGDARHGIRPEDTGVLLRLQPPLAHVIFPQCHDWCGEARLLAPSTGVFCFVLEVRLVVNYELRGSICAQDMGWGKTALMLALVQRGAEEAARAARGERNLIVVPPKVFRQWLAESITWLGLQEVPKNRCLRFPHGELCVWPCADYREFKKLDFKKLMTEEALAVLLVPSSLFSSKTFDSACLTWFRDVKWTRLIVDEAHEIVNLPERAQEVLLQIPRRFTHLLTATPQPEPGAMGVARLAFLLGVSLSADAERLCEWYSFSLDPLVNRMAANFLRESALAQGTAFELPVEQRLVYVELSRAEAVIYENFVSHQERAPTTRQLLELCSHFTQTGATNAFQEISVLIDQRARELEQLQARAKGALAMMALLALGLGEVDSLRARLDQAQCPIKETRQRAWMEGKREVHACVEDLLLQSPKTLLRLLPGSVADLRRGADTSNLLSKLGRALTDKGGEPVNEKVTQRVLAPFFADYSGAEGQGIFGDHAPSAKAALKEQLQHYLTQDFLELGISKLSLLFLRRSLQDLRDEGGVCPVCLESLHNGEATCMPQCCHSFHENCLVSSYRSSDACPICRQAISGIYATKAADPWPKYGSKIQVAIETLQAIMRDYPGERALVFVQFKTMRRKLELAFKEFKVPFLTLSGSASAQGTVVERWQNGHDPSDFVMMLSCEEHNSGITLTRARSWDGKRRREREQIENDVPQIPASTCERERDDITEGRRAVGGVRRDTETDAHSARVPSLTGTSSCCIHSMRDPSRRRWPWRDRRSGASTASVKRRRPSSCGVS